MVSETSLAAQQCRLREWAEQIRDCQNRAEGTSIIEWCSRNGIQKLIIITGSAASGRHALSSFRRRLKRGRLSCHPYFHTVPPTASCNGQSQWRHFAILHKKAKFWL